VKLIPPPGAHPRPGHRVADPRRSDVGPARPRPRHLVPVCFVTGLLSHLIQQPPGWFSWPARPAGLYRLLVVLAGVWLVVAGDMVRRVLVVRSKSPR